MDCIGSVYELSFEDALTSVVEGPTLKEMFLKWKRALKKLK